VRMQRIGLQLKVVDNGRIGPWNTCRLLGTILPSAKKTVPRPGNQITRSLMCLRKTYGAGNLLFKKM
jgi:hypothetical protein